MTILHILVILDIVIHRAVSRLGDVVLTLRVSFIGSSAINTLFYNSPS